MADAPGLGAKLKALRRRENLTQVELATRLGISPSYLNLIENNRRPLTAPLLIRLAQLFQIELNAFGADQDSRLGADLLEAFGDPLFESHGLTNADIQELSASPNVAGAVLTLYRSYIAARESVSALAEKLSAGDEVAGVDPSRLPSEEVSDLIQRHMNYFPELEEGAEGLWRAAELDAEDVYRGLVRYLAAVHRIQVRVVRVADERKAMRRYDAEARVINLSEVLPPRSRRFQLAHQVGLITQSARLDQIARAEDHLTAPESRALARVAAANYFAAALLMPYQPFLEAARAERYDIELLAHRFGASFEQVCHRLTTLRRPGAEGVPLHLLRIDIAGNISKRFSGSGIRFARFSGACPRWNVHAAFLTPGMIRTQLSRMADGSVFFCIARTVRSDRGGYHVPHTVQAIGLGCQVGFARELVYADGVDLDNPAAAVPVGVTCRLCEHLDCEQRAFPSLHHPLRVDENVRGVSFFAPVEPAK
jgi:predicted transcriptional regulator/DNA-binding XRE family transcriptional regulator